MTDREIMQQALNALKQTFQFQQTRDVIAALEAALAQPEQEPVALKMVYGEVCYQSKHDDQSFGMWCPITEREFPNGTPFYTAPPRKEWVGLTDEERNEMIGKIQHDQFTRQRDLIGKTQIITEMYLKERNT